MVTDQAERRQGLLNKLLALRDEDPALFSAVVAFDLPEHYERERQESHEDYKDRMSNAWKTPNPLAKSKIGRRGRPRSAYTGVITSVWRHVSFISWRDQKDITSVCNKLARERFYVLVTDTESGEINKSDDETRMLLIYPGGSGQDPGLNMRKLYYQFEQKIEPARQATERHILEQFKKSHLGEKSIYPPGSSDLVFTAKEALQCD